ncbi:ribose-5-phosphate isomerase RpiA [Sphingomonas bacterium]|uniref:ribose-5-phosphate isomerase RpiA n=1 Tax=Sphingomonas bacterium TaxID=1895847 RepID=UPI002613F0CE|nr:ribose-5-phosphate isomerase RpiA [Sphingomonas bacterium]MDB5678397.1 ribose 5-phosphate isomerase [Sphingomonas bacterium]
MQDDDKKLAAETAIAEIRDGMRVGLGSGSTVAFAIAAIGRQLASWPKATFFSTSQSTTRAAREAGISIARFADQVEIDLAIDGVDEIDPQFCAIKGGGGALLREKVVASAAERMVAIADGSKQVGVLGAPVPVEVLPFAQMFVAGRVAALDGEPMLRAAGDKEYRTNQGNLILDCHFGAIFDSEKLAFELQAIPGVLGHGLFLTEVAAAYIADKGVVTKMERNAA